MDIDVEKDADSPLRVNVEGEELVIRVGINRMDGSEAHPSIPALKFDSLAIWLTEVIAEIENEDETGASPLSDMLDKAMVSAIENGATGIAEDSPTTVGQCCKCINDQLAVRWDTKAGGFVCMECE